MSLKLPRGFFVFAQIYMKLCLIEPRILYGACVPIGSYTVTQAIFRHVLAPSAFLLDGE